MQLCCPLRTGHPSCSADKTVSTARLPAFGDRKAATQMRSEAGKADIEAQTAKEHLVHGVVLDLPDNAARCTKDRFGDAEMQR